METVTPHGHKRAWLAASAGLVAGAALFVWWSKYPHPKLDSLESMLDECSRSLSGFRGIMRRAAVAADEGLSLVDDVRRNLSDKR